jgi:hypothetical protein
MYVSPQFAPEHVEQDALHPDLGHSIYFINLNLKRFKLLHITFSWSQLIDLSVAPIS